MLKMLAALISFMILRRISSPKTLILDGFAAIRRFWSMNRNALGELHESKCVWRVESPASAQYHSSSINLPGLHFGETKLSSLAYHKNKWF